MPFPESRNVGAVMNHINQHQPGWPLRQKRAAALSTARRHGAKIDPYKEAVRREKEKG